MYEIADSPFKQGQLVLSEENSNRFSVVTQTYLAGHRLGFVEGRTGLLNSTLTLHPDMSCLAAS